MGKILIKKTEAEQMLGFPLYFTDGEIEVKIENLDPEKIYVYIWAIEKTLTPKIIARETWDNCQEKHMVSDILYPIGIDADLTTCLPISLLSVLGEERGIEETPIGSFFYVNLCIN